MAACSPSNVLASIFCLSTALLEIRSASSFETFETTAFLGLVFSVACSLTFGSSVDLGSTTELPTPLSPDAPVTLALDLGSVTLETPPLGFFATSCLTRGTLTPLASDLISLSVTSVCSFAFVFVLINGKASCASGVSANMRLIFVFTLPEMFLFPASVANS